MKEAKAWNIFASSI